MDILIKKLLDIQTFLKFTYGSLAILAGVDKFTNLLTNWPEYLNPILVDILPVSGRTFMIVVGTVEIIAGVLVLLKPKVGAYVVLCWLLLVALSLFASGRFLDVAVRDLMLAVGAFTLAKLSDLRMSSRPVH